MIDIKVGDKFILPHIDKTKLFTVTYVNRSEVRNCQWGANGTANLKDKSEIRHNYFINFLLTQCIRVEQNINRIYADGF